MQNITDFLNESIQINEDKVSQMAYNKIAKYLKKETLDMSDKGFGGFGKDGKSMFVEFYRAVIFEGFVDVNYGELKKENESLGKKHIKKIDPKMRKYMDGRLLDDEFVNNVVSTITKICKWDATTFAMAMTLFFENEGLRDMKVSDGQELKEL